MNIPTGEVEFENIGHKRIRLVGSIMGKVDFFLTTSKAK